MAGRPIFPLSLGQCLADPQEFIKALDAVNAVVQLSSKMNKTVVREWGGAWVVVCVGGAWGGSSVPLLFICCCCSSSTGSV